MKEGGWLKKKGERDKWRGERDEKGRGRKKTEEKEEAQALCNSKGAQGQEGRLHSTKLLLPA